MCVMEGPRLLGRTLIPRQIGLGVAEVEGELCAMLRILDEDSDGTLDVIIDKAMLGQIMAHGDEVRRQIDKETVKP